MEIRLDLLDEGNQLGTVMVALAFISKKKFKKFRPYNFAATLRKKAGEKADLVG